jgi:uncharacterized membrane protein
MIYVIIGFALSVFSVAWISFATYYSGSGWIGIMVGGYFILKGRERIGLKNKAGKWGRG